MSKRRKRWVITWEDVVVGGGKKKRMVDTRYNFVMKPGIDDICLDGQVYRRVGETITKL